LALELKKRFDMSAYKFTLKDGPDSPATHNSTHRAVKKGESFVTAKADEIAYYKGLPGEFAAEPVEPVATRTPLLNEAAPPRKGRRKSDPPLPPKTVDPSLDDADRELIDEDEDGDSDDDEELDDESEETDEDSDSDDDESDDESDDEESDEPVVKKYTAAELNKLNHKELVKLAVKTLGVPVKDAEKSSKKDLIQAITSGQG
jgi:hypothetical protein